MCTFNVMILKIKHIWMKNNFCIEKSCAYSYLRRMRPHASWMKFLLCHCNCIWISLNNWSKSKLINFSSSGFSIHFHTRISMVVMMCFVSTLPWGRVDDLIGQCWPHKFVYKHIAEVESGRNNCAQDSIFLAKMNSVWLLKIVGPIVSKPQNSGLPTVKIDRLLIAIVVFL